MDNKILLTIGRQYGSGGHEIGQRLSEKLNINLYDKKILEEAAKQSSMDTEIFEKFDEKPTNSFLYSLAMGTYPLQNPMGEYELPLPEKVFLAEFHEIKKIANNTSAIFVGRCANYTLKDYANHISIFIYAPLEKRIHRIMRIQNVNENDATEIIRKADKQRASYYNHYTSKKWGRTDSYHLCIDSSLCGIDGTVNVIIRVLYEKKLIN